MASSSLLTLFFTTIVVSIWMLQCNAQQSNFNSYYTYLWGTDHFTVNPQGTNVQLKLDKASGAGFKSKSDFGSGWFHIKLKAPGGTSGGVNTNFYLIDHQGGNHCEVDFELLGTTGILQTNVFVNDSGNREQKFNLWFNPSQDFHSYDLLWNSHQLVFFVDKIPIRVFKNNAAKGIPYLTSPMHLEATIWDAPWAGKVDYSQAPFLANYADFPIQACTTQQGNCFANQYSWNAQQLWDLTPAQKAQMQQYRQKYMSYDYCNDAPRRKPECAFNNN